MISINVNLEEYNSSQEYGVTSFGTKNSEVIS